MLKSNIAVGLDIGTTKVCVVVAEKDELGKLNVLGKGRSNSDGLQRATVVNINKTVDSIKAAVADAERESSIRILGVNVGKRRRGRSKYGNKRPKPGAEA